MRPGSSPGGGKVAEPIARRPIENILRRAVRRRSFPIANGGTLAAHDHVKARASWLASLVFSSFSGCGFFDAVCKPADAHCSPGALFVLYYSSPKAITSFSIPSQGLVGVIRGAQISIIAPGLTSFTPMIAEFTTTGSEVRIGAVPQLSGVTPNDFSTNLLYTVVAPDGSTQNYTVTVTAPLTYGGGSLHIWVRASALALSDGAAVAAWPDLSGRGNAFSQAVLANQPVFRANQINGLPAVELSAASTSNMTIAAPSGTLYSDAGADQNGSLFAVLASKGNSGQVLLNLGGGNGRQFDFGGGGPTTLSQGRNGVGFNYVSTASFADGAYIGLGVVQNGATLISEFHNGELKGSGAPACCPTYITAGAVNLSFGGLNADVAELLYFNTALPQNEIDKIFCYLRTQYNLGAANGSCGN